MNKTSKTALGGIISALSLAVMMLTVIPVMTYVSPMIASAFIMLIVIEIDKKWSFGVYAVVSLLSLLISTDKEAALIYITFFGYYPIVKSIFEKHIKGVMLWIVKFALFNTSVIVTYYILLYVLHLQIEGLGDFGKWTIPILLGLGNMAFFCYDRLFLTPYITLYYNRWQKKFHKLFKISKK